MTCCGQGRTALRASQAASQPRPPVAFRVAAGAGHAAVAPPARPAVPVRYLGASPIVVRGAVSGRAYRFAIGSSVQPVDHRDVAGLLRKGIFRRQA